ncbi:MAG: DUF6454 family protein [Rhodothermales bacterium]
MAQSALPQTFMELSRQTQWAEIEAIPVKFDTYHPQGFALVNDVLFVSSVEVTTPTRRFASLQNGMGRSAGSGKGHLFKMDLDGNLLASIQLGEGDMYHPGGIDYDGTWLWIPVAEYRPHSNSVVYRVDPHTLAVEEVFKYEDHIGGIMHNTDGQTLHGVSWGSRTFYTWTLNENQAVTNAAVKPAMLQEPNPSHYVDYQDCMYAGDQLGICSGLATYYNGQVRFALGGLELVDLENGLPVHQVPFPFWTETGQSMMQNPVALELNEQVLRLYAMPEDNQSRLFIYETRIDEEE